MRWDSLWTPTVSLPCSLSLFFSHIHAFSFKISFSSLAIIVIILTEV
jgi:hypothetical protein